jgi:hypothetical protein
MGLKPVINLHNHHVIPKYEGGSDDPSNLVELTVTQHAMWHFAEWKRKGRWQDEKAWKGLARLLSHQEVVEEAVRAGARKAGAKIRDNRLGIFGRSPEQHARDSGSGRVKGKWWNNGSIQGRFLDLPEGEGWRQGRLSGSMRWWNNGEQTKRQKECPGPEWAPGRGSPDKW